MTVKEKVADVPLKRVKSREAVVKKERTTERKRVTPSKAVEEIKPRTPTPQVSYRFSHSFHPSIPIIVVLPTNSTMDIHFMRSKSKKSWGVIWINRRIIASPIRNKFFKTCVADLEHRKKSGFGTIQSVKKSLCNTQRNIDRPTYRLMQIKGSRWTVLYEDAHFGLK